ncbi:MAG: 16S rRNA (cytidine(1402)-2'-O)-methyltransferase [Blastochloris viridis]|uniref:Ribosomal RNA small subunit methyltransferase I n=1 Tax=Blastochloris viridis TaxID=1079 RepID=A0A6N4R231_BLAVI|nr:MAG: 16S rRNA (cytidine(1402)-2'-O)-methyltransferase [Blastochloris viridis]
MKIQETNAFGVLQVVGTPIGNLADMSPRASEAMQKADLIACEDTRRTGQLLRLLGLKTPRMVSCYKENEGSRMAQIVAEIGAGKRVVLVSDGGMPGISDPGAKVVAAVRAAGLRVEVIPGPSAVATAVAGSGFDGGFVFAGFPERKDKALRAQLAAMAAEERTLVFYESPQRVEDTVAVALDVWGNRPAWLARELTKLHEEWMGPDLASILVEIKARGGVKGECVLVVAGGQGVVAEGLEDAAIVARLKAGDSVKTVAGWVADVEGVSKSEAYTRVQALKDGLK